MKTVLRWTGYTLASLVLFVVFVSVSELVRGFLMVAGLVVGCWYSLDRKLNQRLDGISKALESLRNQRRDT